VLVEILLQDILGERMEWVGAVPCSIGPWILVNPRESLGVPQMFLATFKDCPFKEVPNSMLPASQYLRTHAELRI
jgi:hypothetical protein